MLKCHRGSEKLGGAGTNIRNRGGYWITDTNWYLFRKCRYLDRTRLYQCICWLLWFMHFPVCRKEGKTSVISTLAGWKYDFHNLHYIFLVFVRGTSSEPRPGKCLAFSYSCSCTVCHHISHHRSECCPVFAATPE